jgi:anti-anti-sigma factor
MARSKVFDASSDGSTLIVMPSGSVGSLAGDDVNFELEDLLRRIDESALKHVIFDFQSVAYFGSSMLGAMHAIWKHVHADGGKMALCNVSDVEREVLQVSRFDTLWTICDSREEALATVAEA